MKQISKLLALCLLLSFGFFSCKKEDEKTKNTPNTYYFSADINGEKVYFEHLKDNYGVGAGDARSNSGDKEWMGQTTVFMNAFDNSQPQVQIEVVKSFNDTTFIECDDVKEMFGVKSYNFGVKVHGLKTPKDGVSITYYDKNGEEWSTDNGTGDQSGSSFKIVEHTPNAKRLTEFSEYTSKAEFNCTLYNNNGKAIKLKDGKMWGLTVQCNNL